MSSVRVRQNRVFACRSCGPTFFPLVMESFMFWRWARRITAICTDSVEGRNTSVRKFILNTIKQRQGKNVYFTTLFDLYASPGNFPGKAENVRNAADPTPYVLALEQAFEHDINHHRFIAHLQLHEYETMLFAEPEAFAIAFESCEEEIKLLKAIAASEPSIEHIDDGKLTAPSKRIINILPEYDGRKSIVGPDIAEFIGVAKIRAACPHFERWLARLEGIPWEQE
jgi:hypothetical protein